MAGQSQINPILAKLGTSLDAAVKQHANDATEYGRLPLPPNISNGIAQIIACGFGEYKSGDNTGQPFFRMAASIVEPRSVIWNGVEQVVAGQQTSVMEPFCDTKNGQGEVTPRAVHLATIMNYLRTVAGEKATANCKTVGDVDALCKRIENNGKNGAKPIYVKFSTSVRKGRESIDKVTRQKKTSADGVWENWHGSVGLENYQPPAKRGVQVADSEPHVNGDAAKPPTNRLTGAGQAVATAAEQPDDGSSADQFAADEQAEMEAAGQQQQDEQPVLTFDELIELVVAGNADDADPEVNQQGVDAFAEMLRRGAELGLTQQRIEDASWDEVREMFEQAAAGSDEPPAEEAEQQEMPAEQPEVEEVAEELEPEPEPPPAPRTVAKPAVKPAATTSQPKLRSVWLFQKTDAAGKPLAGKDKKPLKPKEHQVTAVDSKSKTCTLQDMADPKAVVKAVPWSKLMPVKQ